VLPSGTCLLWYPAGSPLGVLVRVAGYKDRMERFFQSNPGMSSRIGHHLDFPDYSPDELLAIAHLMLDQQQ
jgi:hypothetical protein